MYKIFINNIFVAYGGSCIVFQESDIEHYQNTQYIGNVFYRISGEEKALRHGTTTFWTVTEFESAVNTAGGTANGNTYQDPLFKDVSLNYNESYGSFDFDLLLDSPAINFGTSTGAPSDDLRDYVRTLSIPDAGCYESPYTQPPVAPTDLKSIK